MIHTQLHEREFSLSGYLWEMVVLRDQTPGVQILNH